MTKKAIMRRLSLLAGICPSVNVIAAEAVEWVRASDEARRLREARIAAQHPKAEGEWCPEVLGSWCWSELAEQDEDGNLVTIGPLPREKWCKACVTAQALHAEYMTEARKQGAALGRLRRLARQVIEREGKP